MAGNILESSKPLDKEKQVVKETPKVEQKQSVSIKAPIKPLPTAS